MRCVGIFLMTDITDGHGFDFLKNFQSYPCPYLMSVVETPFYMF